ncbi:MAG TPA: ABC transporter permease [Acidimicrobiales bacterium]|nr:ABC transporter permease [Acidimicrobiales bacterium]
MIRRLRSAFVPYALALPAGLWLAIFFVAPMIVMLSVALETGSLISGFTLTWHFATFWQAIDLYHVQFIRSFVYGLVTTVLTIVIGYPVAYWIAFRGGRRKSTYLLLILLPFFVSFVIRTVSWQFLLADNGILLGHLKAWHLIPQNFHVLATSFAVVLGLTYNFLPFMILPIYVGLERVDESLLDAAADLYSSKRQAFLRVVLPLSVPGVFAGVLLTFVPAVSDYVNAQILGGTSTTMIGNIIETVYLENNQYPTAAALSFVLLAALLIGIFAYARALGTEDVFEAAAA